MLRAHSQERVAHEVEQMEVVKTPKICTALKAKEDCRPAMPGIGSDCIGSPARVRHRASLRHWQQLPRPWLGAHLA